jgi:hypothetical protein
VAASFAAGPNALLAPLPSLRVALAGGSMAFSWPLNVPGFTLESTTNLQAPTVWVPVTNTPVLQNGQHTVVMPVSNSCLFFRLRQ